MLGDVLGGPVPPRQLQEAGDVAGGVAGADELGRVAADDAVVGHVLDDHRAGGDDRAVTDADAGHHHGVVPEPDVMADDGVTPAGQAGDQVEVLGP
jgi:hypothetical protein